MNQLTNQQVESFHRDGYLHIENAISQSTVSLCRQACERMRSKCESGRYPNIRHEYLIADNEFRGIEHIFSEPVFEEEILKALIETKVLEFSKQLLKEDEVSLILNRLHCSIMACQAFGIEMELAERTGTYKAVYTFIMKRASLSYLART